MGEDIKVPCFWWIGASIPGMEADKLTGNLCSTVTLFASRCRVYLRVYNVYIYVYVSVCVTNDMYVCVYFSLILVVYSYLSA